MFNQILKILFNITQHGFYLFYLFLFFLCVCVCTECVIGWFGIKCSQPCVGYYSDGVNCNHVTGLCDNGCGAGWTESMCDKGNICNFTNLGFKIIFLFNINII